MPTFRRLALFPPLLALIACASVPFVITATAPSGAASAVPAQAATSTPRSAAAASATSVAAATPSASPAAAATPAALPFTLDQAADAQAALLPAFAADDGALPQASRYVIDVVFSFDGGRAARYTGREAIRYTNREAAALDSIYLMLWPNYGPQYIGGLALGPVTIGGVAVQPVLEDRGLAARLPLVQPLAPGASLDLQADFTGHAEDGLGQGARFGLTQGLLLAPTFYPLIPRIVDGQWQTERPADGGDTTNSDTSFYAWRVSAPAELAIAASGVVASQSQTGSSQTQTLLTGPMRDLALAIGPLQRSQRTLPDGVLLNAWVLPEHAAQAAALLDQAGGQEQNLDARVGPYPFAELDVVDAPGAYGGIEYPGLVFIGVVDATGSFEEATVHEVGHQWFYSLIGDDQLHQPWLDEAAASYTELLYEQAVNGPEAAARSLAYFRDFAASASDPSLPIGRGVGDYPSDRDYGAIVYGKGALFFDALRAKLGDDTFFQFLHNYYERYRYGFADSAGFEAVAEQTCGCDLKPLFDEWVFGPR